MDRKVLFVVIVLVIFAGFLAMNFFPTPVESKASFEELKEKASAILEENSINLGALINEDLSVVEYSKIEKAKEKLLNLKKENSDNSEIAELVDVFVALLSEIKVMKEFVELQKTIDKLNDEGLCKNVELLNEYSKKAEEVYNLFLLHKLLIDDFIKKYPKESIDLNIYKYKIDEDQAFINYSELKGYIVNKLEACVGQVEQ